MYNALEASEDVGGFGVRFSSPRPQQPFYSMILVYKTAHGYGGCREHYAIRVPKKKWRRGLRRVEYISCG